MARDGHPSVINVAVLSTADETRVEIPPLDGYCVDVAKIRARARGAGAGADVGRASPMSPAMSRAALANPGGPSLIALTTATSEVHGGRKWRCGRWLSRRNHPPTPLAAGAPCPAFAAATVATLVAAAVVAAAVTTT